MRVAVCTAEVGAQAYRATAEAIECRPVEPFADGVASWALAEIVEAEAGILETDAPERAEATLERAVARVAGGEAGGRRPPRAHRASVACKPS